MRIDIGFGVRPQAVDVPDANLIGILAPNEVPAGLTGEAAVKQSLLNPIGCLRLRELAKPNQKVAIITSDITRPVPSYKIIPSLLEELWLAGVLPGDVTVVFALGNHRPHTEDEMRKLAGGEVASQVRCIDGDPRSFRHLGTTKMGTPVDIVTCVAEADLRIGVGNIEYHYFAGYSGGAKAIMPGVSTRAAIQSNHSRMVLPEAAAGKLDGNPVRMDIEEAAEYCPLHFICNVVLDEHKEIVFAASGHYIRAHRAGCAFLDTLYKKEIDELADIVVVSQGGYPKDINLYQTQKALDNAKHAVKDGGIVILVGSCKEGLGERVFEEWMTTCKSPREMIERIQRDFQLGGHKAAAIAMVLEKSDIWLVSEMEPDFVSGIFLTPFADAQAALDKAFGVLGGHARVLVMPYGGSTLPEYKKAGRS